MKGTGGSPSGRLSGRAASNAWYLRDFGITAQMNYRQRWLADNAGPNLENRLGTGP